VTVFGGTSAVTADDLDAVQAALPWAPP
jgi:hypothetical protein